MEWRSPTLFIEWKRVCGVVAALRSWRALDLRRAVRDCHACCVTMNFMVRSAPFATWLVAFGSLVSLHGQQEPLEKDHQVEDDPVVKKPRLVRFVYRSHPSLRVGKALRVDFRAKFHTDFRGFDPFVTTDEGLFDFQRARVGIEGNFLKIFEFELERELSPHKNPWRDAYGNFRYFKRAQLKAGKFKIPFGRDQLTSPTNLPFILRSRIGDHLTPARDIGFMFHGRFYERGLNYQVGFFREDGENAKTRDNEGTGENVFAARVTGTPLRLLNVSPHLKNLEIGGAFTNSHVPAGVRGLRGRTAARETFFPHSNAFGRRIRVGAEAYWNDGPFTVTGEFIHVRDTRTNQGLRGEDLPNLISRGWYLSGAWVVLGKKKPDQSEPANNFPLHRSLGAVEIGARAEQIRFGSSEHPGRPSRSLRAANVLPNSDRAVTMGVNWYMNRFMKVQFNVIREKIEDVQRSPIGGVSIYWTRMVRMQFVM